MSSKKVLAILGSPRADGVTAAMLDYSIREAEKAGYIVSKIKLYFLRHLHIGLMSPPR